VLARGASASTVEVAFRAGDNTRLGCSCCFEAVSQMVLGWAVSASHAASVMRPHVQGFAGRGVGVGVLM
jgi:hypothetical protein